MTKMFAAWLLIAAVLAVRSFGRPSYAIGLYMLTFFANPKFWWWGNEYGDIRWNFYAGVLLIITVLASNSRVDMKMERPLSSTAVPFLALMAANAILVHVVFAANSDSSLGWLTIRLKFILLFFLIQYAVRDEKDFRITAWSIALGMAYIGYEVMVNDRGSFSGGRLEGVGAAGVQSSNQLASLLITGIPLATTLVVTTRDWRLKAAALLCAGLSFNVVLMCNSRGAFLGVLLAGAVFVWMASGPARKRSLRLVGVALFGTFLLLGDPEILERFKTTFTEEGQRDASAQNRIRFWTAAGKMIADYPFGSGGNSFSEGRGWQYLGGDEERGTRAIHNGFITEIADWGVQGFAVTMLFLAAVWKTTLRGRRLAVRAGDADAVVVFACVAAALTAWMVSSVFGDYLDEEWGYWTAALAYSYIRVHWPAGAAEQPDDATTDPMPTPERTLAPAASRGATS